MRSKAADFHDVYRLLNAQLMSYRSGRINAKKLIEAHSKAERMIGHVEVQGMGTWTGDSSQSPDPKP